MEIKLRRFELSDLEKVMKIEKISFPESPAYPKSYFQRYYQKYPQGFIAAENKGNVIGYTIGQAKNGVPAKRVAEIISLAVKPEFRQKSVGWALTEFLVNHFRDKNVKEISLHVRTKNRAAISFFQNLGFKILKTIKNYYRNGDDAYLMKLSLHLNPRSASPRSGI